jgi:hypothetical protein
VDTQTAIAKSHNGADIIEQLGLLNKGAFIATA